MQLTKINGQYEISLPKHRAERPEWDIKRGGWEVKRIEEMLKTIKKGDIVFDNGTEEGDISAILQKYTGCQMVLFEPNDRVWPCIKVIWEANKLPEPLGFYPGFLSNNDKSHYIKCNLSMIEGEMIHDHGFKQLYEQYPDVPQITLDKFCQQSGIYPDVITMDVEGAEFEVIKGAEKTIAEHKPVIFMSVHPEFMYESYRNEGAWKEIYGEKQHVVHMLRFIDVLGFTHRCIEYDYHELHMVFEPLK